ncbi:hypothetical protein PV11_06842 [Exophiala sideris]|uniref:FAD/NAD(P)-binding domain-containing protein n=1 Tax=Exophiala sideris TaxID=1016849 RepID=A0A0D1YEN1_9EURO|nr:hypothetical protein PV11_06842 [Exophiala sideris]
MKDPTAFRSFDQVPGELPEGCLPPSMDLAPVARQALDLINNLGPENLASNVIWRDLLAFTGYYRTFYSGYSVFETFKKLCKQRLCSSFDLLGQREARVVSIDEQCSWVDVDVTFNVQHGSLRADCMGTISVVLPVATGTWKIWMLRTWLERFEDHGDPDTFRSPLNGVHEPTRQTTSAERTSSGEGEQEFDVIIVGGGQCGLSVAGRLRALGVSYVLLEKHNHIGANWTSKYESLKWHTAKEYGNLPFGHTFPPADPYMMPGPRIAAGFKAWSEKYDLNICTNTQVESAVWNPGQEFWTVTSSSPSTGETTRLRTARHLILAIGTGQASPAYPSWATPEKVRLSGFNGTIQHSFAGYRSPEQWAGKRGIVIGTANTGHDVAEDMANVGMDTTIVQRNPTFVFPAEWLQRAQDRNFNAETDPADGDRQSFTYPMKIMREMADRAFWPLVAANHENFDALERAGFMLDRFGDLYDNLYVRMGGHYVDTGASARIVKGEINVKTTPVKRLGQDALIFDDGSAVGVDLIVLCTGFNHDFRKDAARIVGQHVADQMDDFWGIDAEGELRGNAKPAGHSNLWYMGGGVQMARFFSRFLSLQIQAAVMVIP